MCKVCLLLHRTRICQELRSTPPAANGKKMGVRSQMAISDLAAEVTYYLSEKWQSP